MLTSCVESGLQHAFVHADRCAVACMKDFPLCAHDIDALYLTLIEEVFEAAPPWDKRDTTPVRNLRGPLVPHGRQVVARGDEEGWGQLDSIDRGVAVQ